MQQPLVKDFFDENTNTFSYVVADLATLQCAIIDSVLDTIRHRPLQKQPMLI